MVEHIVFHQRQIPSYFQYFQFAHCIYPVAEDACEVLSRKIKFARCILEIVGSLFDYSSNGFTDVTYIYIYISFTIKANGYWAYKIDQTNRLSTVI